MKEQNEIDQEKASTSVVLDHLVRLRSCPFCGGEADYMQVGHCRHAVECMDCGVDILSADKAGAFEAWNMRYDSWISVDDKLPEPDKWYFISDGEGQHFAAYVKGLGFLGTNGEALDTCVKFWMPLPKGPNAE